MEPASQALLFTTGSKFRHISLFASIDNPLSDSRAETYAGRVARRRNFRHRRDIHVHASDVPVLPVREFLLDRGRTYGLTYTRPMLYAFRSASVIDNSLVAHFVTSPPLGMLSTVA